MFLYQLRTKDYLLFSILYRYYILFLKISQFFKSRDAIDEGFDKDVFEALIYKVIIGEKDKDGNCNPYVIRFIIKNGTEDNFKSRDDGIMNTLLEEDNLILDFESFQKFVSGSFRWGWECDSVWQE